MLQLFPLLHYFLLHVFINGQSISFLILLSGDEEINPGNRHNSSESFSICQWHLKSMSACNYAKLFSLKAYTAIQKFDIICWSEIYLNSSAAPDGNWQISGYSLVRSDHPCSLKEFVYTIHIFCHCKFLSFNAYMNV